MRGAARGSPSLAGLRLMASLVATASCARSGLASGEGFVEVTGGRVWYRIAGGGTGTPLLVLHGGPGVPSYYLKPLAALADERPVVFYEQLGAGRSDHPSDTTLWRVERFLDEIGRVRRALGLDEVHLYGHSWGSMLAVEYLLTRPTGVRSLLLAGPALDLPRYLRDADSLLKTLPDTIQAVVARHERDGTCSAPEYQGALFAFYQQFFARRQPWSADLDSTVRQMDPASATAIGGPCTFTASGPLASYDATARLGEISVPTLFLAGHYDPSTPATSRFYQSLLPGSELAVFDSSGHLPMHDEPERYNAVIRDFLRRVEAR